MSITKYPPGWDEKRVKRVLAHYESQGEEEAVAEDEEAYILEGHSMVELPDEILPQVRRLLARHRAKKAG